MKRVFEYRRRKLHFKWEIERDGLLVVERSVGRDQKERVKQRRFRTTANAKRAIDDAVLARLTDEWVELGVKRKRFVTSGPAAVAAAKRTLIALTVPILRARGFEGSFPNFRRIEKDRHSVVWFSVRSAGGLSVLLAAVPPHAGSSAASDARRLFSVRNKRRESLQALVLPRDWNLFFFNDAAAKWGHDWPEHVARGIVTALEKKGFPWLDRQGKPSALK